MQPKILTTKPSRDYELLDSGAGEKLERYGSYVLRRPDPQALWKKNLPETEWKKADATFLGQRGWKYNEKMQNEPVPSEIARARSVQFRTGWQISFGDLTFNIKPTAFKHTGVFPEQESNWIWIKEKIKNSGKQAKILNLFGYTGGATLAALSAGAEVVHVDGSKTAVHWAKENAEISGLSKKPVRFIIDDARKFVMREIKRGVKYDGIVMDPPAFGRGAKGEIWKIEENLLPFLELCEQVLSDNPIFFLINGYASGYSSVAYKQALEPIMKKFSGEIEHGELMIGSADDRLLPCGIFARWSN